MHNMNGVNQYQSYAARRTLKDKMKLSLTQRRKNNLKNKQKTIES